MTLKEVRKKAGLRRDFVASALGVTGDHLNSIERGKTALSLLKIETLASLYNIDFGEMAKVALETLKKGVKDNG